MIRETITWTLDGREIPAERDWRASAAVDVGFGGYDQADVTVPRRYLRDADQGSELRAYRSSGRLRWDGRLARPPKVREGRAFLRGQGPKVVAEKAVMALLYQSRDYALWAALDSQPYGYSNNSRFTVDSQGHLKWTLSEGTTFPNQASSRDGAGFVFWAQGLPKIEGIVNRIAGTMSGSDVTNHHFKIRIFKGTGPSGALTEDTTGGYFLDDSGSTFDRSLSPNADDLVIVRFSHELSEAYTIPAGGITALVTDLRVNGIASGDSMTADQLFTDLGIRCGYEIVGSAIKGTGTNILPLYWTTDQGPISALMSYGAMFDDYRAIVVDSVDPTLFGGLRFGPWGDDGRTWTFALERNAQEQLEDLELFNEVVQPYQTLAGTPAQSVIDASPDPLANTAIHNAGTPILNQYVAQALADPQPNGSLATSVARVLISRLAVPQVAGTFRVVEAVGPQGPVSHYEVQAGDLGNISDYETPQGYGQLPPQRIVRTDWSVDGTDVTVSQDLSVAAVLAKAATAKARAS